MVSVELKPLLSRLNHFCTRSLEAAAGLCVSKGSYEIGVEHLLLILMEDTACDVQFILRHFEIEPAHLQKVLQKSIETEQTGNPKRPVFSSVLIELIQEAWVHGSIEFNQADIRSGMLLYAVVANQRRFGLDDYFTVLERISTEQLKKQFMEIVAGSKEHSSVIKSEELMSGDGGTVSQQPAADTALGKYTIDFTGSARRGEIDPVFCRDKEIRQMIDILVRRRKNNPILVGEAGVGKSAVVEGLALKIVENDVPDALKGTSIYGLDLGLLQAGASVKGEFEQRLKSVISEVKASPKPIILFIDEAHTLIGAGGSAGGSDAANLLKPALARGELRTMAATTWSEYKKYFEKDPALARRFQLVKIDEPSVDEAVTIMRGLREKYEQAHKVYIRDDAVAASASLAARYLSGRQLPDKSVDLLDTACARVKINLSAQPEHIEAKLRTIKLLERHRDAIKRDLETGSRTDNSEITELEDQITTIATEANSLKKRWLEEQKAVNNVLALRNQLNNIFPQDDTGEGDSTDDQLDKDQIRDQLTNAEAQLVQIQGETPLIKYEVDPDAMSSVVSDWTGIPVGNMVKDEAKSVLEFAQNLGKRIKGQDQALDVVDRRIRAEKAGLGSPHTPIAVLLFVGPSGVGKTECALGIGDLLFGGERFVTSINMSEFQEKHTLSRLIGSPPGYVGYGEGGLLTEAVRQRPYSVVLLDEVEKADLEVLNLFYQVFDKGTLSDGEGREIDFKNTVIVLTSNLASDVITQMTSGDERPPMDVVLEATRPILSNHFKPALLARMDIVPFYPIDTTAMKDIVRLKLGQLENRIWDSQKIEFKYDDKVVESIANKCTEVETGARNIDYIVNKTLLPHISTEVLTHMAQDISPHTLNIGIDGNGDFTYHFLV